MSAVGFTIFGNPNTPVTRILMRGHDTDQLLVPPLYIAIQEEDWKQVQELLTKGADPNALKVCVGTFLTDLPDHWTNQGRKTIRDQSPLRNTCLCLSQRFQPMLLSAKMQFFRAVQALVDAGAKVDQASLSAILKRPNFSLDESEVRAKWQNDVLQLITILLEADATPDKQGSKAWALLPNAARHGHLQAVTFLLDNNMDPNCTGPKNESALGAAFLSKNLEIVDFLLEKGAAFNMRTLISFFMAATRENDPQAIQKLFMHPKIKTPDFTFYFGDEQKMDIRDWLLAWAIENQHEELACLLKVKGAML